MVWEDIERILLPGLSGQAGGISFACDATVFRKESIS